MKRWKYVLIVAAMTNLLASQLLYFVSSYAYWPLAFTGLACWLGLIPLVLWAVVRRRWRYSAILSLTLVVVALPGLGAPQLANWLQETGFRLYASSPEVYLSRCKLFEFVDGDSAKQQVGQCERIPQTSDSWISVIYDPTGQLVLPADQRSKAWKSVMELHLPAGAFVARTNGASRIFGNFYAVGIPFKENDLRELMWLREP